MCTLVMKNNMRLPIIVIIMANLLQAMASSSYRHSRLIKENYSEDCGEPVLLRTSRILGGDPAEPNKWPWMVALNRNVSGERIFCGGTLISDRHVLTAAQCVEGYEYTLKQISLSCSHIYSRYTLDELSLTMGEYDFKQTGETLSEVYNLESLEVHEYYSPRRFKNNIAILKTDRPVRMNKSVKPICLPRIKTKTFANERGVVIGFGNEKQREETSHILREVRVRIWTHSECEQAYSAAKPHFKVERTMLCAGEEGKDSCQGDAGGPLNCYNQRRRKWELCGIVSNGFGCGQKDFPGIYTRVTEFVDWVDEIMSSMPTSLAL